MARDCPTKKTKVRSAEITKIKEGDKEEGAQAQSSYSVQDMVARAMKFSDEERLAFILGL